MNSYLPRMRHHFIILIYICCPEVDKNINNKHDVHNELNDCERITVAISLAILVPVVRLIKEEGCDVRREYGRVDDQDEDEPVPDGLKRGVVQDGTSVDARWL